MSCLDLLASSRGHKASAQLSQHRRLGRQELCTLSRGNPELLSRSRSVVCTALKLPSHFAAAGQHGPGHGVCSFRQRSSGSQAKLGDPRLRSAPFRKFDAIRELCCSRFLGLAWKSRSAFGFWESLSQAAASSPPALPHAMLSCGNPALRPQKRKQGRTQQWHLLQRPPCSRMLGTKQVWP